MWTGDANGKCETLKETGIIGSLRWWYEAIVRGLGGYACDPTSKGKCELNGKEKTEKKRIEKFCPVCYLFGCGGWKRRFNLEVSSKTSTPFQLTTLSKNNRNWLSKVFEKSVNSTLPYGEVNLNFKQLKNEEVKEQIEALISVMAHIGAIGAKTQYGFGQFDWENKMGLQDALIVIKEFLENKNFKRRNNDSELSSLTNFWFYDLTLSPNKMLRKFQNVGFVGKHESSNFLPVSFDIRYKIPELNVNGLREYYRQSHDKKETSNIFGSKKVGSKVFVSHIFRKKVDGYSLRVWGFTEDYVGKEVGEGLKNLFDLEKVPPMIIGKKLCYGG